MRQNAAREIPESNWQLGNRVSLDPVGQAVSGRITESTDAAMGNACWPSRSADQFGDPGVCGGLNRFASKRASLGYSTGLAGSTRNASSCSACFAASKALGVVTDASGDGYVTGFTTTIDFPVVFKACTRNLPGSYLSNVGCVSEVTVAVGIGYST